MPQKNPLLDSPKEIILFSIRIICPLVVLPLRGIKEGWKITLITGIKILIGLEICVAKIILQKLQILLPLWKDSNYFIVKNAQLMLRVMDLKL